MSATKEAMNFVKEELPFYNLGVFNSFMELEESERNTIIHKKYSEINFDYQIYLLPVSFSADYTISFNIGDGKDYVRFYITERNEIMILAGDNLIGNEEYYSEFVDLFSTWISDEGLLEEALYGDEETYEGTIHNTKYKKYACFRTLTYRVVGSK